MKLHCLGTAGYHAGPSRHTSSYFLPKPSILLDAGTGTFRVAPRLESDSLDVLLSHAHLDHIIGLTYFLGMASTTRLKQVRVYGEATKLAAIKTHLFSELIFPILPPIEWIELESLGPSFSLGEARVTWFPLEHPGGSVGYRLDLDGRSLAYVTDTCAQSDAAYVSLIQQVDLLVHECNFADRDHSFAKKTGHSWVSQVLNVARLAQVKQLLLTHFNPFDQRQDPVELEAVLASIPETLPFEVTIASDESVIDF